VKQFLDTSVLVPAFREDHPHHEPSFRILETADRSHSYCALHSLAEFYSTITALPLKTPVLPEQALLFINEIRDRLTPIFLEPDEYHAEITRCAAQGISRGRIYDALILRCAAKSKAETIYTWNMKHFQLIAPALAHKLRTPDAASDHG
jgi:predicted nucleic acid-binding protein